MSISDVVKLLADIGVSAADVEAAMDSPEINAAVIKKAAEVESYWKSIAPVFGDRPPKRAEPPEGEPGAYRDSIHTTYKKTPDGLEAKVGTRDHKASWIEHGTAHIPEYACRQRTVDHFNGEGREVKA